MTEATPLLIRQRIQRIQDPKARLSLMATFLFDARVSEIVAKVAPSDREFTTPRGPRGIDVHHDVFEAGELKAEAAVFDLTSSHGSGRPRACAVPLDPRFEPWTAPLLAHFQRVGDRHAFPYTRQAVGEWGRRAFAGLTYPIEAYTIAQQQGEQLEKGEKPGHLTVDRHHRNVAVHGLRHLRTLELITVFGFNLVEASTYGGWRLGGRATGVSAAVARYVSLDWRSYFPKLLKRQIALVKHEGR